MLLKKRLFKLAACTLTFLTVQPADLIAFSYNRPLQLYALLESVENHISGAEQTTVLYRSDSKYEAAYKQVEQRFNNIKFVKQQNKNDFKALLLNILNRSSSFVVFAVDDIVVRRNIDLANDAKVLTETGAYGFYYRLGRNITHCYALYAKTPPPTLNQIQNNIYSFKLSEGKGDWNYPNSVDMTLVRKSDIMHLFEKLNYRTPSSLEGEWAGYADYSRNGLCYNESAMVNFPLNIVGEYKGNRNAKSYTIEQLLEKFNSGLKLDIVDASSFVPVSPHMEHNLKFIPR